MVCSVSRQENPSSSRNSTAARGAKRSHVGTIVSCDHGRFGSLAVLGQEANGRVSRLQTWKGEHRQLCWWCWWCWCCPGTGLEHQTTQHLITSTTSTDYLPNSARWNRLFAASRLPCATPSTPQRLVDRSPPWLLTGMGLPRQRERRAQQRGSDSGPPGCPQTVPTRVSRESPGRSLSKCRCSELQGAVGALRLPYEYVVGLDDGGASPRHRPPGTE